MRLYLRAAHKLEYCVVLALDDTNTIDVCYKELPPRSRLKPQTA